MAASSSSEVKPFSDSVRYDRFTEINRSNSTELNSLSNAATDKERPPAVTDQDSEPVYFRDINFVILDVIQRQYSDHDIADLITYLTNGTLPTSQKLARDIILKHSDYAIINDMLFHSHQVKSNRAKSHNGYQLVVPRIMMQDVLHQYHAMVEYRTRQIIELYYFQKMSPSVSDYVKSCQQCQKRNISHVPTKSDIISYPTPSAPFEVWEIDLYRPLSSSTQGSSYIFTAVDMGGGNTRDVLGAA